MIWPFETLFKLPVEDAGGFEVLEDSVSEQFQFFCCGCGEHVLFSRADIIEQRLYPPWYCFRCRARIEAERAAARGCLQ